MTDRPPVNAPNRHRRPPRLAALVLLALLAGAVSVRAQTTTPPGSSTPGTVVDPVDQDRFKSGGGGGGILPPNMGTGKPPKTGVGPKGTSPIPNPVTPKSPLGRLLEVPGSSSGGPGGGGGGGGGGGNDGDPPPDDDDGTGPTTSDLADDGGRPADDGRDVGERAPVAARGWVVERVLVEESAGGRHVTLQLVDATGARLVVIARRGAAPR